MDRNKLAVKMKGRPNTDVNHPDYVSKIFCCKRNQDSTILYQKRCKMFQKRVASDEDKTDATAAAALILLSQVPDPVTGTSRESCREQKKDVLIKNMERKMGLSQTSVYYGVYFDGLKEAFNKDQLLISPPVIVLKIMLQAIFQPV